MKNKALIGRLVLSFLAVVCVVMALYFVRFDRNITGFFRFGTVYPLPPDLQESCVFKTDGEQGYDGQFFLAIALDPFMKNAGTVKSIDYPRYRYKRILFSVLGHIAGIGRAEFIPYALVLLNVLCVPVLILMALLYYSSFGGKSSTAINFLALGIPGIWISLSLTTSDLLGSTLFLSAVCALRYRKVWLGAILLSLAGLTRETYIVISMFALIMMIIKKEKRFVLPFVMAIILPVLWNLYVVNRFPGGADRFAEHFGLPLTGIIMKVREIFGSTVSVSSLFDALLFGMTLLVVAFAVYILAGNEFKSDPLITGALVVYISMFVFGQKQLFGYYAGFCRVFMDLYLILLLSLSNQRVFRWKLSALLLSCAASLLFMVNYVFL